MGEKTIIDRQLPTGGTDRFHVDFDANTVHIETGNKHPVTGEPLVRFVSENVEPFRSTLFQVTSPQGQLIGEFQQTKVSGPEHIQLISPPEPDPQKDYLDELEALGQLEPTSVTSAGSAPVHQDFDPTSTLERTDSEDAEFQEEFKKLIAEEEATRQEGDESSGDDEQGYENRDDESEERR